jgi:hypothetical protein
MERRELQKRFVDRFADASSPASVNPDQLVAVEHALDVRFPEAYREFVGHYGPLRLGGILRLIVSYEINLWDIRSFLTEVELLDVARLYANAGLKSSLIGFASDSMGNLFCFDRADLGIRKDDAPVWFFDHEFSVDFRISASFDAWLSRYVDLPAVPKLA